MSIGHREFQIPRDLFNAPGNSPNYFSLGFAMFFSSPRNLFPGLDREGLLRPPSILPPSVPGKSAETFAELLHLLRGYPVDIRDEAHRASLLKDCRYFNFKGLEQRLIPHSITFNQSRLRDEITLRLEDILKSGVSVATEPTMSDPLAGWVSYARPYVDDNAAELVLEVGGEATRLQPGHRHVQFLRDARLRVSRLLEVVAAKLDVQPFRPPLPLLPAEPAQGSGSPTDDLIPALVGPEASVVLDGKPWTPGDEVDDEEDDDMATDDSLLPGRKRRRIESQGGAGGGDDWVIKTGQWRLRIQSSGNARSPVECVFVAVKLDAISSERARNSARGFLNL